jgi:hypothetical protein
MGPLRQRLCLPGEGKRDPREKVASKKQYCIVAQCVGYTGSMEKVTEVG